MAPDRGIGVSRAPFRPPARPCLHGSMISGGGESWPRAAE